MVKLLVVEDKGIVAKDIQNTLKRLGYAVPTVVSSGEEAIKKAVEIHPDLVLMDIVLKGDMDGIEAAEQIHNRLNIPVVYLTAYADKNILQRAKITEPFGYILKPFEEKELHTAIEMALYKHKIESKLKESEKKFRDLAELLPQTLFEIDMEGNFAFLNRNAFDTFGYTQENFDKGLNIFQMITPEDRNRAKRNIQRVLTGEKIGVIEYTVQRKDGSTFPAIVHLTPIIHENNPVGLRGIIVDISERKKTERELLKIQKLESLGTLAGGIAHDFNNILTAIIGNISLAKMSVKPGDKVSKLLTEAERASLRAKDLTQQLLTFSKGGAPVKKTAFIADLVKESIDFALSGSNVEAEFSIPDDLWPVEVDEGQISQVIGNLTINAVEAMPEGGLIKVHAENITLDAEGIPPLKEERYIEIFIKDQGIGIPEEHLSKIFDPYFTTKQKGNGLGLMTAYSIIKNHDGYITAESKIGFGTILYIYLPASKKQISRKKREEEKPISGKGKVLVMDDEEIVRDVLGKMLKYIGYEVDFAKDGAEAIELYKKTRESGKPFDAVILDLTVPGGIGGKEAIKKLLEIDPEVKAIISSGYSSDPIMSKFREYGFSGFVAKPCILKELSKVLHKVVKVANFM